MHSRATPCRDIRYHRHSCTKHKCPVSQAHRRFAQCCARRRPAFLLRWDLQDNNKPFLRATTHPWAILANQSRALRSFHATFAEDVLAGYLHQTRSMRLRRCASRLSRRLACCRCDAVPVRSRVRKQSRTAYRTKACHDRKKSETRRSLLLLYLKCTAKAPQSR
ncbi:hypothetical protein P171DRAFT_16991 [Karstenula rhodostoma CBS 690.94]|uniref:Uncharacterized protein n=1 Tax=Karstenula rhodostoma CBS 690.94 TaxID=1392251 RepID=A0A9P4UK62_9PLEO|nr:hypothetical protein P171DRAFT_16991 [Karstenula rhodostoma CBS 690.94]